MSTADRRHFLGKSAYPTLLEKINSFKELKQDWDSYGADPISAKTVEIATQMGKLLTREAQAAPGSDGSISFEWHDGDDTLILGVEPVPNGHVLSLYFSIQGQEWESVDITSRIILKKQK